MNSRVYARVVATVDGRMERTDGRKTGFLYRAMPEAGAKKKKKETLQDSILFILCKSTFSPFFVVFVPVGTISFLYQ